MTSPGPSSPPPSSGIGCTGMAIVLTVLLVMALICGGLCAGFFLLVPRLVANAQQTAARIQARVALPNPGPPPAYNEWITAAALARLYKDALEAVAANKEVLAHLGDPIEIAGAGEELYKRQRSGPLNEAFEKITFEIQGPKGTGTVTVIGKGDPQMHVVKISVKCRDGTVIQVPFRQNPQPLEQ